VIADLPGTTLWYEPPVPGSAAAGRRPCLVLHGGLGLDHRMYRTLDPLADTLDLVYFDHRHNGRSGRPPLDTVTIPQLADDAAALAAHLGHERVVVLGHSYGGFVAQELAVRHPDLVEALILVDTTPGQRGAGEDPADLAGPPPSPKVAAVLGRMPATEDEYGPWYTDLMVSYLWQDDGAGLRSLLATTVFDQAVTVQGFVALGQWSVVDRLATVACPTLVLVGGHDPVTPLPQALRIARHLPPGTRVVVFEDSGHMPWIDEPTPTFDTIRSWLAHHRLSPAEPAIPSPG
jgi:proline iminopeptidase